MQDWIYYPLQIGVKVLKYLKVLKKNECGRGVFCHILLIKGWY